MPKQQVNIGSQPSDGSGDPMRVGFDKINQNFTELYTFLGGITGNANLGEPISTFVTSVAGRTGNVTLTVSDVIGAASRGYIDNQLQTQVNTAVGNLIGSAPTTILVLQNLVDIIANAPTQATDFLTQLNDNRIYIDDQIANLTALLALKESIVNVNTKIQSNIAPITANVTSLSTAVDTLVGQMLTKASSASVYTKAEVDAMLSLAIDNDNGYIGEPELETDDYGSI